MARKLLTLLIAISSIITIPSCKQFLPGKNTEATVKFIVGTVTLNGRPAATGDRVKFGDIIETGGQSSCDILIAKKNLLSLAPNTRFLYRVTTRGSNCELTQGALGALLRNRDATGEFNIRTPSITASVRGTVFYIAAEKSNRTYACVCNGRIHFKPDSTGGFLVKFIDNRAEQPVSAHHHKAYFYSRVGNAISVEKAGLLYHTDHGVEKMAASIGEKIDWTTIE